MRQGFEDIGYAGPWTSEALNPSHGETAEELAREGQRLAHLLARLGSTLSSRKEAPAIRPGPLSLCLVAGAGLERLSDTLGRACLPSPREHA